MCVCCSLEEKKKRKEKKTLLDFFSFCFLNGVWCGGAFVSSLAALFLSFTVLGEFDHVVLLLLLLLSEHLLLGS